jgi:hypothetical protein
MKHKQQKEKQHEDNQAQKKENGSNQERIPLQVWKTEPD